MYLGIIQHVYRVTDGTGLKVEDYLAPLVSDELGIWGGWKTLCLRLWKEEKIWESQRIFSYLVNVLREEEIHQLFRTLTQSTGSSYEVIHALAYLSAINSLMEPGATFSRPFIFRETARAREREQLVKETRARALNVCHDASVDKDCRQLLEVRALEALWSFIDSNDLEARDIAAKKLEEVLHKSTVNNDFILIMKSSKYLSEVSKLIFQRAEAREKRESQAEKAPLVGEGVLRSQEEERQWVEYSQWQEEDLQRRMRFQREREDLVREREDLVREQADIIRERHALLLERNVFLQEREAYVREQQASLQELSAKARLKSKQDQRDVLTRVRRRLGLYRPQDLESI